MDLLDIIIYIAIAISGTVFGSFFTLAVHRIPKNQDITHQRSYCPKCNHKLQFLDLIPVFSYIFLGGKCRYCKEKIRPRYLILELLSGCFFILLALFNHINYSSSLETWIWFGFKVLFAVALFITAGIDAELIKIDRRVTFYGFIIGILQIVFIKIIGKSIIFNILPLIVLLLLWIFMHEYSIKQEDKDNNVFKYFTSVIELLLVIYLFIGSTTFVIGIPIFLFLTVCYNFLKSLFKLDEDVPIGFIASAVYLTLMVIL